MDKLHGVDRLMAMIIYGAGLRLGECLSLRVKDIDFDRVLPGHQGGQGQKGPRTVLPERVVDELKRHLAKARTVYDRDQARHENGGWIPHTLALKYPGSSTEWGWFWVFPSNRLPIDPDSGKVRRYHVLPGTLQRAVQARRCPRGHREETPWFTPCATASQPTSSSGGATTSAPSRRAARSLGCVDHDDLHPCGDKEHARRAESGEISCRGRDDHNRLIGR